MIKPPNQLRIKSKVQYEVVYQDEIKNDKNCVGLCDANTKHIYIKNGLSKTELSKTLIHEILHCWQFEYDIKIEHKSIYQLEHAIHNFIKLNKWI